MTEPDYLSIIRERGSGALDKKMGIEITEASLTRLVGTMPVEGNTQPMGILHGGANVVLAESLGSVESLADHPASMTHASVPADIRQELGVVDGFIRLSCGVEDIEDLLKDVEELLKIIGSIQKTVRNS